MMDFDLAQLMSELRQKSPVFVQAFFQESKAVQEEILNVLFKHLQIVTRSEFDQQQVRLVELERRCIALEKGLAQVEKTSS